MFNVLMVKSCRHQLMAIILDSAILQHFDSIALNDPKDGCQKLMHALTIPSVRIELRIDKQYIKHLLLSRRFAEKVVVLHASLHVLVDLFSMCFVLSKRRPG